MERNDWNSLEYREYNKTINRTLWGVVLYLAVFQVGTLLSTTILFVNKMNQENLAKLEALSNTSGIPYFIGVGLGLLLIFAISTPNMRQQYFALGQRKITVKVLAILTVILLAVQALTSIYGGVLEGLLNGFGYSAAQQVQDATSGGNTWSMILYTALLAPVAEEIVFRGFILRNLQKYGAKLAIVVSAIMFGLAHANIIQTPFAFILGLVLGYVAYTYGIIWSIGLHLFNNLVLGNVLSSFYQMLGGLGSLMSMIISVGSLLIVLYLWFINADKLKECGQKYKIKEGLLMRVICLPSILLTVWSLMQIFGTLTKKG